MRYSLIIFCAIVLAGATLVACADDQFVVKTPQQIQFKPMPDRPGLAYSALLGDIDQPGPFILRVKFAPGAATTPHFHDRNLYVSVITGNWYSGTTAAIDFTTAERLGPGSFRVHPRNAIHYDGANEVAAVVELTGSGPLSTEAASNGGVATDGSGFTTISLAATPFVPVPGRDGIAIANLVGDPSEAGWYVLRIRFSPGVMSTPHWHDQNRYATVVSGTWYTGTQREFDRAATVGLEAGSFMIHPAGAIHFDGAKDAEVNVELRGMGPVKTELVRD